MDSFLCPLGEKNRRHCFNFKGKEWRKISGFFIEKHSNKGTLSRLVKFPHPWGKLILRPFYNPPTGWPGVLPLGEANDICIMHKYKQYVHLFTRQTCAKGVNKKSVILVSRYSVYLSRQKFQRPRDQREDRIQGRDWLRLWMHHEKYRQSEDCCTRNNRVLIKERVSWRRTYFAHKIQSSKTVFKEAVSVTMRLLF